MASKTWLVAVMKGEECLAAENIVASRNYIPRLIEICSILDKHIADLSDYEIIIVRDNWRNTLHENDIRKFAGAMK